VIGLSLATVLCKRLSLSPFLRYHPHPGPQPAVSSSIWFVRPFPSKVSKTRVLQGLSSDIPGYFLSPVTKFQVKYSSLPFGKVGLFTTPSHVSSPHLFQQQAATRFSILALNWVRFVHRCYHCSFYHHIRFRVPFTGVPLARRNS
jgi:hypothetical protein